MNLLRDMPIKRKVTVMILTASLVSLVLVSASLFVFQWLTFSKTVKRDLKAQASIVAANSTAVVAFSDKAAARETLASLKANPHIVSAALYDPAGQLFAVYQKQNGANSVQPSISTTPLSENLVFDGPYLLLYEPVSMNEKRLATLFLCLDVRTMRKEILLPQLSIGAGIFAAASLIAWLLSSFLQPVLTRPILRLAEMARAVAEKQD